jgi:hypothetical protein
MIPASVAEKRLPDQISALFGEVKVNRIERPGPDGRLTARKGWHNLALRHNGAEE